MVTVKVSMGIMGKGTESFRSGGVRQCSRNAVDGSCYCAQHKAVSDKRKAVLAARKAAK